MKVTGFIPLLRQNQTGKTEIIHGLVLKSEVFLLLLGLCYYSAIAYKNCFLRTKHGRHYY